METRLQSNSTYATNTSQRTDENRPSGSREEKATKQVTFLPRFIWERWPSEFSSIK